MENHSTWENFLYVVSVRSYFNYVNVKVSGVKERTLVLTQKYGAIKESFCYKFRVISLVSSRNEEMKNKKKNRKMIIVTKI